MVIRKVKSSIIFPGAVAIYCNIVPFSDHANDLAFFHDRLTTLPDILGQPRTRSAARRSLSSGVEITSSTAIADDERGVVQWSWWMSG